MKDKNGFTLIELMVSIGLLAVMLVFMMNTLVKLRDTSIAGGIETNLQVGQAIITNGINSDVLNSGGISAYSSGCNGTLSTDALTLNLTNEEQRILELQKNNTVLVYKNPGSENSILVRKTPTGYFYAGFTCELIESRLIKITVQIKDSSNVLPKYTSEILYYNAE